MQKNVEKMTINYSPNFNRKKREKNKIKYLIYHYTGMKNDKLAIKFPSIPSPMTRIFFIIYPLINKNNYLDQLFF